MNISNIGLVIRELREGANVSQMSIEKKVGITRFCISKIENGHTIPTIETLVRIGEAIGIPAWHILKIIQERDR
jgi:transcriptional regulator with XRE-family HTH domain